MRNAASIRWYDTLDSTNSEAKRLLSALPSLSAIAAVRQTGGRGQGDHIWYSMPGENLTFSLVLKDIGLPISRLSLLNEFIVPVIRDFLSSEGVESTVKYPNDILVDGRKICGILIENVLDGKILRDSIIGVGLNLNQTVWIEDIPAPVSLSMLTGKKYPPGQTLERILELCKKYWKRLIP